MGGPENGNFPLLYLTKMSLHRGWVVLKSLKTPLGNIKMAPYRIDGLKKATSYLKGVDQLQKTLLFNILDAI